MFLGVLDLWLPILLSSIAVFIVSSLIWTVIGWHNSDWKKIPDEDRARDALQGLPHGQYTIPYAGNMKAKQDPAWMEKVKEGPSAMVTVVDGDPTKMGKQLTQWFIYILVITFLLAWVASIILPDGSSYMMVFHTIVFIGTMTYAGSHAMGSIWFGHSWKRTLKDILDGLIYAAITGGFFGWLWPAAQVAEQL